MSKDNSTATNDDLMFLLQKLYEKVTTLEEKNNGDHERFSTMLANAVGDIAKIEENMTVHDYHSQQHFSNDAEQDARLDRLEAHLKLPKLAF